MHDENWITSITLDALDKIPTVLMTESMVKEQGIVMENLDLRVTKVVTGYDRVVSLRFRNMRTAWDRESLMAEKLYWRMERRRGDRRTMGHL